MSAVQLDTDPEERRRERNTGYVSLKKLGITGVRPVHTPANIDCLGGLA